MAALPPAGSTTSASLPGQTLSSASISASVSRSSSSSSSSISSASRSASSVLPSVSSPSASASSSISGSASRTMSHSPAASSSAAAADGGGGSQNNSMTVIVPIVAVACALVIIYFAYRLYLLHKRRKDDPTPLPPPRTPAILEQGSINSSNRQSVMYTNPHATPASLSYRNSMRPNSFIYASGASGSTSSNSLYKAPYTSVSGHSSPTGHATTPLHADETGRFSPLPPPSSMRSHSRPHSVASFTSARQSMYAGTNPSPLRGPSYLNRVDIVLPRPLSAQGLPPPSTPSATSHYRHSTYTPDSRSPLSAPVLHGTSREDDWTGRVAANEDAQSSSTCTAHNTQQPPALPPKSPSSTIMPTPRTNPSGAPPSPSAVRGRSMSPPEPLLSSNAFLGSISGSGSDESNERRK